MKFTLISIAALAATAQLASGYSITGADVVNCRSGPGTTHDVVRTYTASDDISITCQSAGESIRGDSLWDKTQDGCFVADYYVKTGTSNYVAAHCDGGAAPPASPPPPPAPGPSSPGACKSVNAAGIALLKEFEGFVASPSPDPIGLPTVGYGHLCQTKGCSEVKQGFPLTPSTAEELLRTDVPKYATCLAGALKDSVTLNDNQFAALVSWVYNVGCGAAGSSSLVRRLNSGEGASIVPGELLQWNKAGGRVFDGLTRRRKAEINLFQTPSSKQAHPNCSS
ncbi:glycoside hydrolase family 24 protein [Martensiomyces pterosporus]|nr:glycoside hydrolase family 24 protein [Martensiomyces pterosporus]